MLYKHIFRNALIPLVTGFPAAFVGAFFAGSVLIETLFSLDGLGLLSFESVVRRDYPVVLGSLYLFTLIGAGGQAGVRPAVRGGRPARAVRGGGQMSGTMPMSAVLPDPRRHGRALARRRQADVAEPARLGALQAQPPRLLCRCGASSSLLVLATLAELVSNDRPLVARYRRRSCTSRCSRTTRKPRFGGDFGTPTDWSDPLIAEQFAKPGNWAFFTLNRYGRAPATPSSRSPARRRRARCNWLGTDSLGQDMVARLLYGFRVSIWFAFALTLVGTAIGIAAGALQGYFGGRVDLVLQRFIEIWGAVPELYLLIIFASIFEPSLLLLLVLLSLWGWMGL